MKEDTRKKLWIRIIVPLLIAVAIIYIFKSGYQAGHWLYELTHE